MKIFAWTVFCLTRIFHLIPMLHWRRWKQKSILVLEYLNSNSRNGMPGWTLMVDNMWRSLHISSPQSLKVLSRLVWFTWWMLRWPIWMGLYLVSSLRYNMLRYSGLAHLMCYIWSELGWLMVQNTLELVHYKVL